ncbi:hydrophobin [Trichoderma evansii]
MKFSMVALFAAGALAVDLCPTGLYSNAQCCGVVVLGVAALDCNTPTPENGPVVNGATLRTNCAREGKQAVCCAIPVAGQELLCQTALP